MSILNSSSERNIKLTFEYDGTEYSGWQRQKNAPSIQEECETALSKVVQHGVKLTGSGRTDAGVHALGQVANFRTGSRLSPKAIMRGANRFLPRDIRIVTSSEVDQAFNARRDAILRWYRYRIVNRSVPPALFRHHFSHVPYRLDMKKMKNSAARLEGTHDFRAFRSHLCAAKRTTLTMEELAITTGEERIFIDLKCRSFLHNMVRIIVGLLIEIARGKIPEIVLEEMLSGSERPCNVPTAPPQGLVLMDVIYPDGQEYS